MISSERDDRLSQVLARTPAMPTGTPDGAAVLVPLVAAGVLLTRRAAGLRHHAGQVAFPGGRIDPADASAEAAALREAQEEIGLDPAAVRVLGRLPAVRTGTGYHVTPVVGRVLGAPVLVASPAEVAAIFVLPAATLRDKAAPSRRATRSDGRLHHHWVWPHDEEYIWGATASILVALARALDQAE